MEEQSVAVSSSASDADNTSDGNKNINSPAEDHVVHIRNLTRKTNEGHLSEIFGTFGKVSSVDIPKDRRTGGSRGIAYVTYETAHDAEQAVIHMDGGQVDGNKINVSFVLVANKLKKGVDGDVRRPFESKNSSTRVLSDRNRVEPQNSSRSQPPSDRNMNTKSEAPRNGGRGRSRSPVSRFQGRDTSNRTPNRSKSPIRGNRRSRSTNRENRMTRNDSRNGAATRGRGAGRDGRQIGGRGNSNRRRFSRSSSRSRSRFSRSRSRHSSPRRHRRRTRTSSRSLSRSSSSFSRRHRSSSRSSSSSSSSSSYSRRDRRRYSRSKSRSRSYSSSSSRSYSTISSRSASRSRSSSTSSSRSKKDSGSSSNRFNEVPTK